MLTRLSRHETLLIAGAAALLHCVLGILLLTPVPYEGGDNATYLALARGLIERGRYLEMWDPLQRSATLYPPLFPLTLAIALSVGLQSWLQLKLVTLLISAAGVFVSVAWLRRVSGRNAAMAGGLLLAVSPGLLQQSGYVLSEGLFWLFTMLALWAFAAKDRTRTRWLIVAAAATAAATLTRSAGLPLVVAAVGALVLERRWRDVTIFVAITLPPMFLWSLRARLVGARGYGSYLTMVDPYRPELGSISAMDFVHRVISNIKAYATEMTPSLIWGSEAPFPAISTILVVAAVVWWAVRLGKGLGTLIMKGSPPPGVERVKIGVLELWFLLYAGLLVVWPEAWAGERFVIAIVPALIYYMAGLLRMVHQHSPVAGTAAAIVVGVLVLAPLPPVLLERASSASACREHVRQTDEFACMPAGFGDFMRVAVAAGEGLPANSVVISRKPTLFYAESRLRSMMYPLSADPAVFLAAADSVGAQHVVVDQLSPLAEMYLNPVVISAISRFCVEETMSRDGAVLLRILPTARPDAPVPDADGYVAMPACVQ